MAIKVYVKLENAFMLWVVLPPPNNLRALKHFYETRNQIWQGLQCQWLLFNLAVKNLLN